jgi:hypothetical protein
MENDKEKVTRQSNIEMQNKKITPSIKSLSLNYFPNDQTKHIDYVIFYKDTPKTDKNIEIKQMRNKFIKQLKMREGFQIQKITRKRTKIENSRSNYLLLNCSLERLMTEAERMHLELPLKDVNYYIYIFFNLKNLVLYLYPVYF